MKLLKYGHEYLRELRNSQNGIELFDVLKHVARQGADAADIAEGVYWFAVHWYDGPADPLYASQCVNPFSPSCLSHGPEDGYGEVIYDALCDKAQELWGVKCNG